jgi:hypothetical protein
MRSISRAFYAKNLKYTARLVYDDESTPRIMNQASLERPQVQHPSSKSDLEAYNSIDKLLPPVIL